MTRGAMVVWRHSVPATDWFFDEFVEGRVLVRSETAPRGQEIPLFVQGPGWVWVFSCASDFRAWGLRNAGSLAFLAAECLQQETSVPPALA